MHPSKINPNPDLRVDSESFVDFLWLFLISSNSNDRILRKSQNKTLGTLLQKKAEVGCEALSCESIGERVMFQLSVSLFVLSVCCLLVGGWLVSAVGVCLVVAVGTVRLLFVCLCSLSPVYLVSLSV